METYQFHTKPIIGYPTDRHGQFDFDRIKPLKCSVDEVPHHESLASNVKIQRWVGLKLSRTLGEEVVMTITAKGSDFYLSGDLKEAIKHRLSKIERLWDRISRVDAILTRVGARFQNWASAVNGSARFRMRHLLSYAILHVRNIS